ncbi:hypothetical protein Tco_1560493 [Tanacetum coccineum]
MVELLFNESKEGKVKMLLVLDFRGMLQVQGAIHLVKQKLSSAIISKAEGKMLDEEELAFLADLAVLMANHSSCDSEVLSEVPYSDTAQNDMLNQSVQELQYSEKSPCDVYPNDELTSDSNIIPYSQYLQETQQVSDLNTDTSAQQNSMILSMLEQTYRERVKILKQRVNVDLSSREKFIDSQMDDMIQNRNTKFDALETEIDTLKQTISKNVKEKESLLTTLNGFKTEFKQKEAKSIDTEIVLKKK